MIQNRYILNLLAHGETTDEILQEYEALTHDDILACIMFTKGVDSYEYNNI